MLLVCGCACFIPLICLPPHLARCAGAARSCVMLGGLKSLTRTQLAGGVVVYVAGVGITYELSRPIPKLPCDCERCATFSNLAPAYDREIEKDEASSGMREGPWPSSLPLAAIRKIHYELKSKNRK